MNKGVVLKTNVNQNYASDCVSRAIIKFIAEKNKIPLQEFIVKNDSPCGSTIGPKITTNTSIKGVDLGVSQLSMHSIRETCGIIDLFYCKQLFESFFAQYDEVSKQLSKLWAILIEFSWNPLNQILCSDGLTKKSFILHLIAGGTWHNISLEAIYHSIFIGCTKQCARINSQTMNGCRNLFSLISF